MARRMKMIRVSDLSEFFECPRKLVFLLGKPSPLTGVPKCVLELAKLTEAQVNKKLQEGQRLHEVHEKSSVSKKTTPAFWVGVAVIAIGALLCLSLLPF